MLLTDPERFARARQVVLESLENVAHVYIIELPLPQIGVTKAKTLHGKDHLLPKKEPCLLLKCVVCQPKK